MDKMSFVTCLFVAALISTSGLVSGAPNKMTSTPSWHLPCGEILETGISDQVKDEDAMKASLENIKLQHQLTLNDYLNRDYEFLYDGIRFGIQDHQYIPNWVPGTKDILTVKNLMTSNYQTIINHLPKLHVDLQKFAVAFEQLIEDESRVKVQEALVSTQSYLLMMLCEVESSIVSMTNVRLPLRVHRSIMTTSEREPVDTTRRLIRDWGVVMKYRDYLHAWRHVFDY